MAAAVSLPPADPAGGLPGKKIALCIGINYKGAAAGLPPLSFAEDDASAMAALLTERGFEPPVLLLGAAATRQRIETEWLAIGEQVADLCVIYLSGHGLRSTGGLDRDRVYFLPFDYDPANPLQGLPISDLAVNFQTSFRAASAFALLDCCYAGDAAGVPGDVQWRASAAEWRQQLAQKVDGAARGSAIAAGGMAVVAPEPGPMYRALIAACPGNFVTRELNVLGHGVATYYALEGWRGRAADLDTGRVTAARLYAYINDRLFYDRQLPPPARAGGVGDVILDQLDGDVALTNSVAGCTIIDRAAVAAAWARAGRAGATSIYDRPGQQTFWQVVVGQDMRRDWIDQLRAAIAAVDDLPGLRYQVITGGAGYGKSMLLLRLQYELAALDGRYVLAPAAEGVPLDYAAVAAACRAAAGNDAARPRRVYLILDNAYRFQTDFLRLLAARPIANLTVIVAARPGDLPRDFLPPGPALPIATADPLAPATYNAAELPALTQREAAELGEKVRMYGTLADAAPTAGPTATPPGVVPPPEEQPPPPPARPGPPAAKVDPRTILAPYLGECDREDRALLFAVMDLTNAGGVATYAARRLVEINDGRDPGHDVPLDEREAWSPFLKIVYCIAVARAWGAYTPQAVLPTLTGLTAAAVDTLLCTPGPTGPRPSGLARAYLRGECGGTWRIDHQLIAQAIVAQLDGSLSAVDRVGRFLLLLITNPSPDGGVLAGQMLRRFAANPRLVLPEGTTRPRPVMQTLVRRILPQLRTLAALTAPAEQLELFAVSYLRLGLWDAARAAVEACFDDPALMTQARIVRGTAFAHQRQPEAALVEYNAALAAKPDDVPLLNHRGVVYSALKQYDLALTDYAHALLLNPDDPITLNNRGVTQRRKGRHGEALADFFHALHARRDDPATLNNRGLVYLHLRRYEQALADFNRSLELRPDDVGTLINRGNVYRRLGRTRAGAYAQALADYTAALQLAPYSFNALNNRGATHRHLKCYKSAIADYTAALDRRKNDPDALHNRGTTYRYMGAYAEAVADFTAALAARGDPGDDPRLRRKVAATLTNRGSTYDNMGLYAEALADYSRALELHPEQARVYYNRGCTYRHQGNLIAALANFDAALRLRPDDPRALNNRGITHHNLGQDDEAEADFTRSLELRPHSAVTYYNRGALYNQQRRLEQALADFNYALSIQGDHVAALNNRGATLDDLGRYTQALEDYTRVLALRPYEPDTLHNRGLTYTRLKQYEKALADFNASLERRPDHHATLQNRGAVYLIHLDQREAAIADFTRALALGPPDPTTLHLRAAAYLRGGQDAEALADLTASLDLRPEHGAARHARAGIYLRQGDYAAAIADLEDALAHHEDRAATLYDLACAHSLRGDLEPALERLVEAIQLDGQYGPAAEQDPRLVAVRATPGFERLISLAEGDHHPVAAPPLVPPPVPDPVPVAPMSPAPTWPEPPAPSPAAALPPALPPASKRKAKPRPPG
ncbi:MAG TPA: tetratricopeptide repeat protein [Chloroflexia bacterium]|nr:tetratricopeptide repeat protein [Chloroflexia bacterium]